MPVSKRYVKDLRLTIELVLDNVGTWKAIKPGKQQNGQLGKHQLGTHKPNIWAGGTELCRLEFELCTNQVRNFMQRKIDKSLRVLRPPPCGNASECLEIGMEALLSEWM